MDDYMPKNGEIIKFRRSRPFLEASKMEKVVNIDYVDFRIEVLKIVDIALAADKKHHVDSIRIDLEDDIDLLFEKLSVERDE